MEVQNEAVLLHRPRWAAVNTERRDGVLANLLRGYTQGRRASSCIRDLLVVTVPGNLEQQQKSHIPVGDALFITRF